MNKELLVVCGEKKKEGITIWDVESGDVLLRIPACSSPPHGLLFLHKHNSLVASQLQKDRPFGCGTISFWPLNKPQVPHISYPMEAIGPIASSKDGIYLAGGTPSGNAYVWEATSGRLLKNRHAHQWPVNCLTLSTDDSFLISCSEDGTICVWSMISLLNAEDRQDAGTSPCFRNWSAHRSSVTGLLPVSFGSDPVFISSSLDGTCKAWDIISGRLLQNHVFSAAVTAVAVDPGEQMLFAGRQDGKIFINMLHLGLQENQIIVSEDESKVLTQHKGPITSLSFNLGGSLLISASVDSTACLWDVDSWQVIRKFTHGKGYITNSMVIPMSSLSATGNRRNFLQPRVSSLEKTPRPNNAAEGTVVLLPRYCSLEYHLFASSLSSSLLKKQILDSQKGMTPEMIQMKIETSIENRLWILNTTKHMNSINQHLRSQVIDKMQDRICGDDDTTVARPNGERANTGDLHENQEETRE